jgi:hypothetical protein
MLDFNAILRRERIERIEKELSEITVSPLNHTSVAELFGNDPSCLAVIDTRTHGGIGVIVTKMTDETDPIPHGVALAHRITRIPAMLQALQAVMDAEALHDAKTAAQNALNLIKERS